MGSSETERALATCWRSAARVVVLSGAGISTASGIPDFRSPGGRWELCSCGEPLKPATISFGQGLLHADLERSLAAAEACDLLVAVGSSLVVSPINEMVPRAARAGASIAILTASETPFDALARFSLREPVEEVLPRVAAAVLH